MDLARMAGLMPAGVLAEVVNDDGSMARQPDLERFAEHHGLTLISEADLIACRTAHETLVRHLAEARLPTPFGAFAAHVFAAGPDGTQHLALVRGEPRRPRRRWSGSTRNV